jgi:hypothetical protein
MIDAGLDQCARTPTSVRARAGIARWFSPTVFAGIVLAFALPFATVSCNGGPVHTNGIQLATWTVPDGHPHATTDDGGSLVYEIESRESLPALLTLLSAVAGFACAVTRRRGEAITTMLGLVFVIAMWFQSFDFADVQYEAGFVLVSLAFPLLIVWHVSAAVVRYRRARRAAQLLSV